MFKTIMEVTRTKNRFHAYFFYSMASRMKGDSQQIFFALHGAGDYSYIEETPVVQERTGYYSSPDDRFHED